MPQTHNKAAASPQPHDVPVALLEQLVAADPNNPLIHRKCGEMYFATKHMDRALASFRRASELAPHDAGIHYALACTWQALGKLQEAEASYRAALQIQPELAGALFNLGLLLRQELGRPMEAISFFQQLLEVQPNHIEAYRSLGLAYFATGQIDGAVASFRRYTELKPDAAIGHYELGCSLNQNGQHADAIVCFEAAIALDPLFADAHLKLGNVQYSLGGFDAAYPHYKRAYELRPLIKRASAKKPAAFSVLALFAPGAANTPLDYLIGHADYDLYILQVLPGIEYDAKRVSGSANILVNLISDVDRGRDILATAQAITSQVGIPVINPPDKILLTDRVSAAERLSGIASCRVPMARRYSGAELQAACDSLAFPALIRQAGTHNGDSFEKVETPEEAAACITNPDGQYYAIEPIDYQSADGHFRKYRMMFVGKEIYPYHLAIGDHWKVHHGTTSMGDHPWMQEEEKRFFASPESVFLPEHFAALRRIREIIGLDFFGIDCGIDRDGNLVVFEVNATMLIHQHNAQFPYKIPYVEQIKNAFDAMLRATAISPPP